MLRSVLVFGVPLLSALTSDRLEVQVAEGRLNGRMVDGVASFRNIPYAAPPVGPLRWRPPQRAQPWAGSRPADRPGAICIQPLVNGDPGVGPLPMSEDCLTLNVWVPDGAERLPVMVWIHGGGYNNGSGTAELYDGTNLARRGVVLVTINYRLGRLGFFDHPALAAERAVDAPAGNYGVMDQIAALEWVRDNVATFGGDPCRVTIFGESAGGVAVTQLMAAPCACGLFQAAIVQSGFGRQRSARLSEDRPGRRSAQSLGLDFACAVGFPGATAEHLRGMPANRLIVPVPAFYSDNLIVDGGVLPEEVVEAFAGGRQAPVPLIIGTNSAEFGYVQPRDAHVYGLLPHLLDARRAALAEAYGGVEGYHARFASDLVFHEPARHLARLHRRAGHPTWLYRFDAVAGSEPEHHGGASHASERPYVFHNLHLVHGSDQARDRTVAALIADYWTGFAKFGEPRSQMGTSWPIADHDRLLEFTNNGPRVIAMPDADRLDLIEAWVEHTLV